MMWEERCGMWSGTGMGAMGRIERMVWGGVGLLYIRGIRSPPQ